MGNISSLLDLIVPVAVGFLTGTFTSDLCDSRELDVERRFGTDFDCTCTIASGIDQASCVQTCQQCFPEGNVCGLRESTYQQNETTQDPSGYETTFEYTYGGDAAVIHFAFFGWPPTACEATKNGVACDSCSVHVDSLEDDTYCFALDCTNHPGEGTYNMCTAEYDLGPTDTIFLGALGELREIYGEQVCDGDELPFDTTMLPTKSPVPTSPPTTVIPTENTTSLPSGIPSLAPTPLLTTVPIVLSTMSPEDPPTATPTNPPSTTPTIAPSANPPAALDTSVSTTTLTNPPSTIQTIAPSTSPPSVSTTPVPTAIPSNRPTVLQADTLQPKDTTTSPVLSLASSLLVLVPILVAGGALCTVGERQN